MSSNAIRQASHAGSWYESDGHHLDEQLSNWLGEATRRTDKRLNARAIIAPHAGYSYSGPTAAFAYQHIDPTNIDRVFLLGPSHHYSLTTCALTSHSQYETPLYNIPVDTQLTSELASTGLFSTMNKQQDADEHSLEMHLPYIAKVFEKWVVHRWLVADLFLCRPAESVSIFNWFLFLSVRSIRRSLRNTADCSLRISAIQEISLLSHRTSVIGVRSTVVLRFLSTFVECLGRRFSYTPQDPSDGEIWQHIEKLDHQGMELIEKLNLTDFHAYLRSTDNTICGRYPISLLLAVSVEHRLCWTFALMFILDYWTSKKGHSIESTASVFDAIRQICSIQSSEEIEWFQC